MNLEYEKIKYKKIIDSKREKFNIERINEKHGEKYLFILYLVDSIRVSDDLTLLITYQARNNEIPLDAFYEKYVLTTLNSNKEHIESIEIGKYESHFGFTIVKTSRISENLELIIETTENTEDFETGEIEIVKKSESYNIVQNGQINKHQ
jgi:antitoxin component of RelBE/YafQ-DinJ toxin-antitoxin module